MKAFTKNSKTILSVDFDRRSTCGQLCEYCYVANMERIYPTYLAKTQRNAEQAKDNGQKFAKTLNDEYRKLKNSRSKALKRLSKLPVRIYGSGDFIPEHSWFLVDLEFEFFVISKNLTTPDYKLYVERLLSLENLTTVVLSFDKNNLSNYKGVSGYQKNPKVKFAYTGTADEYKEVFESDKDFDIFFNISKKKVEMEKSTLYKEACPCDSGKLPHAESCSYCNKCWKAQKN